MYFLWIIDGPEQFIFLTINNRIKQLSHKNFMECLNENMDTEKKKAFLRFHVKNISEEFESL